MDIQEVRENELQVMYDLEHWHVGYWDGDKGRYTCAINVDLSFDTDS